MVIKECYVENFGVLHEYHYCPDRHFCGLYAQNGGGKTTFAAFICAMFYGLSGTRVRKDLEAAQRRKYKPWQSGVWGGWLCFTANGKNYRIERTFADKEREDTFLLIDTDTGNKSEDFTENLGEELFGMTRESYQATAFMSWNRMRVELSEDMRIALLDMTQDTALRNCEAAIVKIDEEYKTYKKTGKRGRIAELMEEINSMSMQEWEIAKKKKENEHLNQDSELYTQKVFTKKEEERLMMLDDYFAAGLLDLEEQEEKLQNIRQSYADCKRKMKNKKKIYSVSEAVIAAVALTGGGILAVMGSIIAAAVILAAAVSEIGIFFFLRFLHDKKYNEELYKLKQQEEKEQLKLSYAREYKELSQKEEVYENMRKSFLRQQQQEKSEMLEKQHIRTLQRLNELQKEKEMLLHRMEVLEKTKRYIMEAKEKYMEHLVKDVSEMFYKYLEAFDRELSDSVTLNTAYEPAVKNHGILREIDYYSSGTKDVIWFCERMAFAYRLSKKERPVVILDDVFLTLDDNMQKKAFTMLKQISEDFQVIYLSCHENTLVKNHDMKYN